MRPSLTSKLLVALACVLLVSAGCSDDDAFDESDQPSVLVEAVPVEGEAPLTVEFSALPRDEVSDAAQWSWDFGDGATTTEQNPDHVYEEPGDYSVNVTLTTEDGETFEYYVDDVRVTGPESEDGAAGPVEFEDWLATINAACATSSEAAAAVPGAPNSPEALEELLAINNAETEAIEAAGIPRHRRDEAVEWLDLRNRGSQLFMDLVENPPTSADDPRPAELQAIGQELSALSEQLGLTECVAEETTPTSQPS